MNHFLKVSLLFIALSSFTLSSAVAQKIGHINSGNIVELLPETKKSAKTLEAFSKQLEDQYAAKVKAFQAKVKDFQRPEYRKDKTMIQLQTLEQDLVKEEQVLLKERQENEQKVLDKRTELLRPIFMKVDEAINAIATEQGYQMIFDSSVFNVLLFKETTYDITDPVKKKLGIVEKKK